MTPTSAFMNRVAGAIATDAGGLAEAAKINIHLAKAAFTPGPDLAVGSMVEADFAGYSALAVGSAVVTVYTDPLTGDYVLLSSEPAGGWHWQATGPLHLPQTIYGWYMTDSTNAFLWEAALFDTPITLTAVGDGLNIASIQTRLNNNSVY